MTVSADIPGRGPLALEHVVLDLNGTLTDRGALLPGVPEALGRVRRELRVHLLSADTFGRLEAVAAHLGVRAGTIADGEDKARFVRELGAERCAAIGNGANDRAMLEAAALGIAVLGPEGSAGVALAAADVVCASILDALALVVDPTALVATLRA